MHKKILIGGLGFNQSPLNCLFQLNLDFIDINLFASPFSLDDIAHFVIQHLDAAGNNILFGYSTGALAAIRVGILKPDMIGQIVLINATPKFIQEGNWNGIKPDDFKKMLVKLNKLDLTDFMLYFASLAAYPRKIRSNSYTGFFSNNNKSTLLNLMNILAVTDLRSQLEQLEDKVVIINSDYDVLIARNPIKARQIYLPDSTHLKLNEIELLREISQILCSKN